MEVIKTNFFLAYRDRFLQMWLACFPKLAQHVPNSSTSSRQAHEFGTHCTTTSAHARHLCKICLCQSLWIPRAVFSLCDCIVILLLRMSSSMFATPRAHARQEAETPQRQSQAVKHPPTRAAADREMSHRPRPAPRRSNTWRCEHARALSYLLLCPKLWFQLWISFSFKQSCQPLKLTKL